MAVEWTDGGIPILTDESLIGDVPEYTRLLGQSVDGVKTELSDQDKLIQGLLAAQPKHTPGFTSSNSTADGAWWHFTAGNTGCPAKVGDVIQVTTQWWHSSSSNILAARLYVYGSNKAISHCNGSTWYWEANMHGTYGANTSYFVASASDVQGSGMVHLSVNMNNGGVASYDTFTCHGWINHGPQTVQALKNFNGEYVDGLPVIAPEVVVDKGSDPA